MTRPAAVILSLLSGVAVSILIQCNAALGTKVGVLPSSFYAHLVGSLFAIPLLVALRRKGLGKLRGTPAILFCGGLLGVFLVVFTNWVIPRIGLSLAISLIIGGSIITSILLDRMGVGGPKLRVSGSEGIGILMLLAGCLLILFN